MRRENRKDFYNITFTNIYIVCILDMLEWSRRTGEVKLEELSFRL